MTIPSVTALPSAPSRSSSPTTFATDADAFMAALPTLVTEINAATAAIPNSVLGIDFSGTSTTSTTIGTGSKTFTTQSGKNWYVGQPVRVSYTTTPANYMDGQVTAYSGTSLTVNVGSVGGAGTQAAWTIGPTPGAGSYATITGVETLINKTLTTPVLSATVAGTTAGQLGYSGGLLSYGNGSASLTLVSTTGTQTLTNKALTAPTITAPAISGGATVDGNLIANAYLGVGTASPGSLVHAYSGSSDGVIQVQSTTGAAQFLSKRNGKFCYTGFDASGNITAIGSDSAVDIVFSNNSYTERMRILSGGGVLVGTTSTTGLATGSSANVGIYLDAVGTLTAQRNNNACLYLAKASGYSDGTLAQFQHNGGSVGSISTNGTTTAYNTSSDQRLKESITDAGASGALIDAIQVRQFDWKADGRHQAFGFIAQELRLVCPDSVNETTGGLLGVDYGSLVPLLMAEVKALRARVAALEA